MEKRIPRLVKAMENPYVEYHQTSRKVIYVPVDFEHTVKKAREQKVLLEINNSSVKDGILPYLKHARENAEGHAKSCYEQHVSSCSLGTDMICRGGGVC